MITPRRIIGVKVLTTFEGREVMVAFRSPYRWRIYENGNDITRDFGHALRGPTLPPHSPEWETFHAETRANERQTRLQAIY